MGSLVTDVYFKRSKLVAEVAGLNPEVLYTVFIRAKRDFIAAGIEHSRKMIEEFNGEIVYSVKDGDKVAAGAKTLFTYKGKFQDLVMIETALLGDLSDACTAATAMNDIVVQAKGKPVLYFGARHRAIGADYMWCLGALAGGANDIASTPNAEILGKNPVGTMPHALCLIAGSTLEVSKMFRNAYPGVPLAVLIDTFGAELDDAKELVKYWGKDLYGVRIDTHGGRLCQGCNEYFDVMISSRGGLNRTLYLKRGELNLAEEYEEKYLFGKGVSVESIYRLRAALDEVGGQHVKIIASSGFNAEKVSVFEAMEAPVDVYGVGLGDVKNYLFATSDIVEVDGKRCHKVGRYENSFDENDRFIPEK